MRFRRARMPSVARSTRSRSTWCFRDDAGYGLAMAGDNDARPALDIVEDAEKLCFGFRCLNRLHKLTSQND